MRIASNISRKWPLMRSLKRPMRRSVGITKPLTGPSRPPRRAIACAMLALVALHAGGELGQVDAGLGQHLHERAVQRRAAARVEQHARGLEREVLELGHALGRRACGTTLLRYLMPNAVWRASSRDT